MKSRKHERCAKKKRIDASVKKYFDMSVSCANKGDRLSSPFVCTIDLFSRSYVSPRNFFSTLPSKTLFSVLDSLISILDSRNIEDRGSSFESRLSTFAA